MREVVIQTLTREAFAPFGTYEQMDQPQGVALTGDLHAFYPDRMQAPATGHMLGFSTITVKRPKRMVIEQVEYHTTTWEMIFPLDDDMILHVSPLSGGTPSLEHTSAFFVPRQTLVYLRPAVWHLAPLPAKAAQLTAMIVLPTCTYKNDCTVVTLAQEDRFELIFPKNE